MNLNPDYGRRSNKKDLAQTDDKLIYRNRYFDNRNFVSSIGKQKAHSPGAVTNGSNFWGNFYNFHVAQYLQVSKTSGQQRLIEENLASTLSFSIKYTTFAAQN